MKKKVIRDLQTIEKKQQPKSFKLSFDRLSQCIILRILDPEMYPFLLVDPECGTYTIRKTREKKIHMTK